MDGCFNENLKASETFRAKLSSRSTTFYWRDTYLTFAGEPKKSAVKTGQGRTKTNSAYPKISLFNIN